MKKIYIISIIILLSFYSCKENNKIVSVVKSINFKTDIVNVYWRYKGLYFDKNLQQEIVYFSDFGQSFIKTYNLQGGLIDSIPLENVLNKFVGQISFIYPYSKDTIFCGKENKILVINHYGDIYHTVNLDSILPDPEKYLYNLIGRSIPYQENSSNKILFHPFLKEYEFLSKKNKLDLDLKSGREFFLKAFHNSPYFLEIKNIFSNKIEYNFEIHNFYKDFFTEKDAMMYSESNFKGINDFIFLISISKNKILKIDANNFDILKEIDVKSKYTDMGASITIEDDLNNTENYKKNALYAGYISELFYNEKIKQYMVIVMHTVKDKEEYDKYNGFDYRPFSIIIYDENFENPKEYVFEANIYICRNSFMSEEGLWIQRKPENLTKENYGIQTFDLLKFN
ncbi:MAG: hypothetical protein LBQ22_03250 [Bacteroidales bacterium]|jgi:hypothetical protein|nr:hypothetical protein [Bacteroidales bacterium]